MSRTPCCERMGLKKGPWTAEEDQILISHIQRYGHGNWRALPKLAGLLRCGKSCRLRWINYLRPDIKRGKFSKEEEDTILKLHEILGNRWSAIAARLPAGRTDNEIKNFWHTHLKKRIEKNGVQNANTSTHTLQEVRAKNLGTILGIPRAVDASSAASSVGGRVMAANYSVESRKSQIFVGPEFQSANSSDTSGETMNNNHGYNQISEEMEFWYNVFMESGQPS